MAKVQTSWISPNHDHDRGLVEFVEAAMRPAPDNRFIKDFAAFADRVVAAGMLNSLSQVLLKIASPGVPDFYQGNELWDLSLVDPDNRRPVDYTIRQSMLAEIMREAASKPLALSKKLFERPDDGRIKMYVTCRALRWRRKHAQLFREGAYVPLEGAGQRGHHLIAFARGSSEHHVIIAAGRFSPASEFCHKGQQVNQPGLIPSFPCLPTCCRNVMSTFSLAKRFTQIASAMLNNSA